MTTTQLKENKSVPKIVITPDELGSKGYEKVFVKNVTLINIVLWKTTSPRHGKL